MQDNQDAKVPIYTATISRDDRSWNIRFPFGSLRFEGIYTRMRILEIAESLLRESVEKGWSGPDATPKAA